jgi:PAS domain-containing protein
VLVVSWFLVGTSLAFAGALFALGDSFQFWTVHLPGATAATQPSQIQFVCLAIGIAAVLIALLSYPTAVSGTRQRLRFILDAATVVLGAVSLIWATSVHTQSDVATALITGGMVMAVTFASLKLKHAGTAPLNGMPLLLCMLATGLQGLAMLLAWHTGSTPAALLALTILPSFLLPTGLRLQRLTNLRQMTATAAPKPVRATSRLTLFLPWVAVGVAAGALIIALLDNGDLNMWGTVVVILLLAAVVVARQVDALIESVKLSENLRDKDRWIRELLRHSSDITSVLDNRGIVKWVSPALFTVLGIAPSEITSTLQRPRRHRGARPARQAPLRGDP